MKDIGQNTYFCFKILHGIANKSSFCQAALLGSITKPGLLVAGTIFHLYVLFSSPIEGCTYNLHIANRRRISILGFHKNVNKFIWYIVVARACER